MTEVFGQRALQKSLILYHTGMTEVFGQRALLSSISYRNDRSVWSEGTSKFYIIQE